MQQPGWYPDPDGSPHQLRWWDGQRWTPHVQPHPAQPAPVASDAGRRQSGAAIAVVGLGLVAVITMVAWLGLRWFGPGVPVSSVSPASNPAARAPAPGSAPTVELTPRFPTIVPSAPVPLPGTRALGPCAPDASAAGTLTDGVLAVSLGARWEADEPSIWFECGETAVLRTAAGDTTVTLGRSLFDAGGDDQQFAEELFTFAQLEAGSLSLQSMESRAVTIDGQPGWMIDALTGGDHRPTQRIVVLTTRAGGQRPSLLLAVGPGEDPASGAELRALLDSVGLR